MMEFHEFIKYFSDYQICYYEDKYKYSALKVKSDEDDIVILKFTITKPGKYQIAIN